MSPDGTVIVLRTYRDLRLWNRDPDESVADALAGPPACSVAVAEPQGEAVAFTADGRGFVTVSEGAGVPVLGAPDPLSGRGRPVRARARP